MKPADVEGAYLCSEQRPGLVEWSRLSQRRLAEGSLPESSGTKRLEPQESCCVHRGNGAGVESRQCWREVSEVV